MGLARCYPISGALAPVQVLCCSGLHLIRERSLTQAVTMTAILDTAHITEEWNSRISWINDLDSRYVFNS